MAGAESGAAAAKRRHALQDLSWPEFQARLPDNPPILLPLGSQEQQGPHAPMGDYVLAERLALSAAERADAICAPVLPFGHADFFRGAAGGVQLRSATFTMVSARARLAMTRPPVMAPATRKVPASMRSGSTS